jgi:carbonic anhydrase/acetyltransferase-like protein (isoleucine patch superfamily)
VVVGEVRIGARSSVWFNAVVRGDTAPISMGAESNLQDGSVVHVDEGLPAAIGDRVTVGHRAIVHGCVIEDECLVGMGAIVLNGARIGSGSLVGAGALVREGQVIPPGSLVVGAPARVVGPVGVAHREAIRRGSSHYAELARSYVARGYAGPHPITGAPAGVGGRPLAWIEWGQLLAVLAESPSWVEERLARAGAERWVAAPAAGGPSALDVTRWLRDADREVHLPELERVLSEELPRLDEAEVASREQAREAGSAPQALAEWREVRQRLLARLGPLGPPEWRRVAIHPRRGPLALADLVRAWVDHDLSQRRRIALAAGAEPV